MTETRTLRDYRPQHDDDCPVVCCGACGYGIPCLYHGAVCGCGLDALLAQPPAQGGISEEDRRDAISLSIFVGRNNISLDNASLAGCREYVEACELLRLALPTRDKETRR